MDILYINVIGKTQWFKNGNGPKNSNFKLSWHCCEAESKANIETLDLLVY